MYFTSNFCIMKMPVLYFSVLLLLICFACNREQNNVALTDGAGSAEYVEMAPPAPVANKMREEDSQAEPQPEAALDRKLIKEGSVEFETEDLAVTRNTIAEAIAKNRAYIASEQEFKHPDRLSTTITVRIPSARFDHFLADATSGVKKFDRKQISTNDVTEEFLDIQARLKTKKELEARYIELLKKANSIKEILEIEQYISQHRAEIESIEGRLKYIQNRVSLSTLTFTFYQRFPEDQEFDNRFTEGFRNGWENLVMLFVVLTNMWPFLLIGAGVWIGIKIWKKKR